MRLWIAQGFGAGRIPFAPGTFGSVAGLAWFALLLCGRSWILFGAGAAAALALSVWLCGRAEERLGKKDPASVVLDEITAMPVCFIASMLLAGAGQRQWAGVDYFFSSAHAVQTAGVFVLFRVFDVLKPWPVGQSQSLPGGWGITVDDVLAAGYVNLVVWGAHAVLGRF